MNAGSCQERCHPLEAFYASFAKVTRRLVCWVANGSLIHMGQLVLALGLVDRRVGAAVEHPIGPELLHHRPAGAGIRQIQGHQPITTVAAAGDQLYVRRHLVAQGMAELAGGTGKEHLHGLPSLAGFRDCTDAGHAPISRQWLCAESSPLA